MRQQQQKKRRELERESTKEISSQGLDEMLIAFTRMSTQEQKKKYQICILIEILWEERRRKKIVVKTLSGVSSNMTAKESFPALRTWYMPFAILMSSAVVVPGGMGGNMQCVRA